MFRNALKSLTIGLVALIVAAPILAGPAGSGSPRTDVIRPVQLARSCQSAAGRYGPYATIDHANRVANYFRSLGYNASIIYNGSLYSGTRTYSVNVW
jgi:hypothetical protein